MPTLARNPLVRVTRAEGRTVVIVLTADLGATHADALGRELDEVGGDLTLDLRAVRFLSSAAVGRLVALAVRVWATGGRVAVLAAAPDVRRVFALTRLDGLLGVTAVAGQPGLTSPVGEEHRGPIPLAS